MGTWVKNFRQTKTEDQQNTFLGSTRIRKACRLIYKIHWSLTRTLIPRSILLLWRKLNYSFLFQQSVVLNRRWFFLPRGHLSEWGAVGRYFCLSHWLGELLAFSIWGAEMLKHPATFHTMKKWPVQNANSTPDEKQFCVG